MWGGGGGELGCGSANYQNKCIGDSTQGVHEFGQVKTV